MENKEIFKEQSNDIQDKVVNYPNVQVTDLPAETDDDKGSIVVATVLGGLSVLSIFGGYYIGTKAVAGGKKLFGKLKKNKAEKTEKSEEQDDDYVDKEIDTELEDEDKNEKTK